MSEQLSIAPNKNDKNVLVPRGDGQIDVMQLSDQFDESGLQIAYKLDEGGQTTTTKSGPPEAFGEGAQAYYANQLAMDRNPTPEEMERGTPIVTNELGDVADKPDAINEAYSGEGAAELSTPEEVAVVEKIVGQLKNPEQALREAKGIFDARFVRIMDSYQPAIETGKASLKDKLNGLPELQARAVQSIRETYEGLQRGLNNPEQAQRMLAAADEQLRESIRTLGVASEAIYEGHKVTRIVRGQIETSAGGLGELRGDFGKISQQIDAAGGLDETIARETGGQVEVEIKGQMTAMRELDQPVAAISDILSGSLAINTESHRIIGQMIGRVEEMNNLARHGRLDMDTYRMITGLLKEVADKMSVTTVSIQKASALEL